MVMHIRVDSERENAKRKFACGIGPELPAGDQWVDIEESSLHHRVDCPGCSEHKRRFGTPISELSGRVGQKGYDKFVNIARSWGYE